MASRIGHITGTRPRGRRIAVPPPRFRTLLATSAIVLVVALGILAGNASYSAAQTSTVDYDVDNDGLIEVGNLDQWRSIQDNPDGDGIVTNLTSHWVTMGYPNAETAAGCPARDHDGNTATPDQAACIGYELVADITTGGNIIGGTYTGMLVGNGFRILNPTGSSSRWGPIRTLGWAGSVEGIGVINPVNNNTSLYKGGLVSELQGSAIGVYVEGGNINGLSTGGLVGVVANHATLGAGLVAHSYVRGTTVGSGTRQFVGGLAGHWGSANTAANRATCLNSYFSGTVNFSSFGGLIGGQNRWSRSSFVNCVGDTTTHNRPALGTNNVSGLTATKAQMTGATDYDTPATNNPFANWDDYAADGTALDAMAPRTDFWYFGDGTTFPVHNYWGHDHTMAMARETDGSTTVNLCSRTLAVANEIIRLLKDDTYAAGITGPVPADITALSDCTASTDTQSVSIDNLRDYAATTLANPLNLSPGRTDPPSARLTALDLNDFAYLVNVQHINLSGNALTSLPPRLFQGLPLIWLDLSDNALTTLPADLFVGLLATSAAGSLANAPTSPATFAGGQVYLNNNSLTDTGIPGRIFDPLSQMNGVDLSDNSLTRINTRWFQQLENLGNRPASHTSLQTRLGLNLSGNTVTEHYRANNLFSGVRYDIVPYTGDTAGDTLKTAIVAVITAAAGGTTPTTLDLDSTDYYTNDPTPGYVAAGMTCAAGSTVGPFGATYIGGSAPDCYAMPHWSPPASADVSAAVPSDAALSLSTGGQLTVTLTHAASDAFVAYQVRQRVLPSDQSAAWTEDWLIVPIDPASGSKSLEAGDGTVGTGYQVQVRVLVALGAGEATTLLLAPDLDAPTEFEITEESGTLVLSWDAPSGFAVDRYEYRTRQAGTTEWSAWMSVDHTGSIGSRQSHRLTNVGSGVALQVELRYVIASTTSPTISGGGSTRVAVPDVDSIQPTVREISVRAGDTVMLAVDVYNAQQKLDNGLATSDDSLLVFSWSESGVGGGSFNAPLSGRRVSYTVPNLPGRYTVQAEAQPDGICMSHHAGATEITAEDRAPCIAIFTISVSRPQDEFVPVPDPVNPPGAIPGSMTDDAGIAYAVFTPVDGGTFTGTGITVSAPAGAVPDRTLLGVSAAASAVPVPAPVPGASMSMAGSFYDVNAITQDGSSPLLRYTLEDPLSVCLPYPDQFRAELANVVAVERKFDGSLGILTTKVRSNAGVLTVCGAVSTLPATVGVAKLGTVPAIPPTPTPDDPLPEAGGASPSNTALVLMLIAGLALFTGIGRIRRMRNP